jgi:uncharacterized protein (DUF885 family)
MSDPATAREALLGVIIGEMKVLLDRFDVLAPTMDIAQKGLAAAAQGLIAGMPGFRGKVTEFVTKQIDNASEQITANAREANKLVIEHIGRRANEIAARTREEQIQAMTAAAREIIAKEIQPQLTQLTQNLKDAVERANHPWTGMLMHALTACWSAGVTAFVLQLLHQ